MKRMVLTETQFDRLRKRLNENISEEYYSKKVRVDVWTQDKTLKYHGYEISDFTADDMTLKFRIYDDRREWGINSLDIVDIKGPDSVDIQVDYLVNDIDEKQATIRLPLDWENSLFTEDNDGQGILSIDNELDIELVKGEDGKIKGRLKIDILRM